MDDDGRMADEHTMEILYCAAKKLYDENRGEHKLLANALVQKGNLLSFKIDHMYTVAEAMMTRELVSEIGYPNKEFFIKGDEVDYKQRAFAAGAYVVTVTEAKYIHPRPETVEKTVMGVKVPFFVEAPWKEYYAARNFTYMYKLQGWYKGILFELIFVKLLAIISLKCKKMETIKMLFKGVYDGWKGNLGDKVKP